MTTATTITRIITTHLRAAGVGRAERINVINWLDVGDIAAGVVAAGVDIDDIADVEDLVGALVASLDDNYWPPYRLERVDAALRAIDATVGGDVVRRAVERIPASTIRCLPDHDIEVDGLEVDEEWREGENRVWAVAYDVATIAGYVARDADESTGEDIEVDLDRLIEHKWAAWIHDVGDLARGCPLCGPDDHGCCCRLYHHGRRLVVVDGRATHRGRCQYVADDSRGRRVEDIIDELRADAETDDDADEAA